MAKLGSFEWAKQIVARDHQQIIEARMSEGSPQLDAPRRSLERAALDIAVAALIEARRNLIVAVRASCDLAPEDFNPENANVVRNIDRALERIAGGVPEAMR